MMENEIGLGYERQRDDEASEDFGARHAGDRSASRDDGSRELAAYLWCDVLKTLAFGQQVGPPRVRTGRTTWRRGSMVRTMTMHMVRRRRRKSRTTLNLTQREGCHSCRVKGATVPAGERLA